MVLVASRSLTDVERASEDKTPVTPGRAEANVWLVPKVSAELESGVLAEMEAEDRFYSDWCAWTKAQMRDLLRFGRAAHCPNRLHRMRMKRQNSVWFDQAPLLLERLAQAGLGLAFPGCLCEDCLTAKDIDPAAMGMHLALKWPPKTAWWNAFMALPVGHRLYVSAEGGMVSDRYRAKNVRVLFGSKFDDDIGITNALEKYDNVELLQLLERIPNRVLNTLTHAQFPLRIVGERVFGARACAVRSQRRVTSFEYAAPTLEPRVLIAALHRAVPDGSGIVLTDRALLSNADGSDRRFSLPWLIDDFLLDLSRVDLFRNPRVPAMEDPHRPVAAWVAAWVLALYDSQLAAQVHFHARLKTALAHHSPLVHDLCTLVCSYIRPSPSSIAPLHPTTFANTTSPLSFPSTRPANPSTLIPAHLSRAA